MIGLLTRIALSCLVVASAALASARVDVARTAVFVIDMQGGFYDRGGTRETEGLQRLVQTQRRLLSWAVSYDVPVLVFEYRGFGPTNNRLTDLLQGHRFEVVQKQVDGAFNYYDSATPSREILERWGVSNLIVSGINGNACVLATVMGALRLGYRVITASDIVGDLNYNPPIYPNSGWFPNHPNFEAAPSLDAIIY